jgi:hypothetical protein
MSSRKQRVEAEASALWRELYDEPAPASVGGADMLDMMLKRLPAASYERLNSPYLRRSAVSWPKRSGR